MRQILRIVFIILFAVISAGFLSILQADAEEGTCVLQALDTDVFIIVFDLDRDGNQGAQIWEGRLNQGESAKITAPHGRFRYNYNAQPDQDQPLSGGQDRSCSNGETIAVP